MRLLLSCLIFLSFPLWGNLQKPFTVNLNTPHYQDGVISTHQGGVINSPELRIQARHIIYTNKTEKSGPIHRVFAEGDLMVEKEGETYVGRRLEYDFITKTGIVYEGVTAIDLWFLGGEQIRLNADQSVYLYNAFVTTSENKQVDWKIHSKEVTVTKQKFLAAKNVSFRFFDTPIFWLPAFKSNLKTLMDSPVRYKVSWDKGLYPQLNMRYRIYSWEQLDLFIRLNIRPSRGIGGALESDYHSFNQRTKFRTRSYIDHDTFYRDTHPNRSRTHYRLQGAYEAHNEEGNTQFHATYDWLNDKNLQTDFSNDVFELNTAKQTGIHIKHFQDWMICGINGRFRINGFQGMKQKLPESFWSPKPFTLGKSGILSQNRVKMAYLDYVSATDIESGIPDFSAARISTQNTLYRPFSYKGFHFTPLVGLTGIFYGDSQDRRPASQAAFHYQALMNLKLQRSYQTLRHVIQPYIAYHGITRPTLSPDTPYIFSIQDGFNQLNQLRTGLRTLLYFRQSPLFEPNIIADIYAYSFMSHSTFINKTPKIEGNFLWNFPSWRIHSSIGWNRERQALDYTNLGLAWTINENFAFKTEFRHRSPFNWRRDDPNNFIMEVTRDISELLHSPLSDKRNTLLSRMQIQITPQWTARLESQLGWGRSGEPHYNKIKVDLITLISTSWKLRLTFTHSPAPKNKTDHFSFSLSLAKK